MFTLTCLGNYFPLAFFFIYLECVNVTQQHRWVIPPFFLTATYIDGRAVAEEARETPRRMKQITAAQPSSAMSLCGDCTGNPAEISRCRHIHKQTLIHTHTHVRTHQHMHAHTHVSCLEKPISTPLFLTEEDIFEHACTRIHTAGHVHAALHLYMMYCSHSSRALLPKAQTCMNALRVFHRLSSYFIHSFEYTQIDWMSV